MGQENFEFKISGGTRVPDPEWISPAELAVILSFMLRLNRNPELRT